MEKVILVDENDNEIGSEEKLKTHQNGGKLHRAFSIFVFNSKGELLLQKRAAGKYHSGLLWSNTCCSHPRPGEAVLAGASRRLKEEMGLNCDLTEKFTFTYKVDFENRLTENEFDHVFFGYFEGQPKPDPKEAAAWQWINMEELKTDIEQNPDKYTYWLKVCFDKVLDSI